MRGGLATIQQTLTPDASAVLAASIAEAAKRNHSQTTPLHVAASLLASPTGFLRNACVRSHPHSSHPLQCRALELCFSVALDRLPSQAGPEQAAHAPPVSNALMAALKRAQAHQRRGCPEQQQQPLLAVKVELEQLVISILDDPSVSRVMREASFSSPAVKAAIEQSINSLPQANPGFRPPPNMYLNPRLLGNSAITGETTPSSNIYLNPRLQQGNSAKTGEANPSANMYLNPRLQQGNSTKNDEVKRISEIFARNKKRNPVLVGESEPREVMSELRKGEILKGMEVIEINKDLVSDKARLVENIRELSSLIEAKIRDSRGMVLDLGDLTWLVEAGRVVVDEIGKIVARFGEGGNGRLWLIGTATCETYLRCQVYHPMMENDWDLQAVPITPRSPFPAMFRRLGGNVNSSLESIGPMMTFQGANSIPTQVPENLTSTRTLTRCPQCTENYEKELAKLVAEEYEKSSSEGRSEPAGPPLPQWLKNAKSDNTDTKTLDKSQAKDQETVFKQKTEDLQKKWSDTCLRIHPSFHQNLGSLRVGPPMTLYNPKLLLNQPLQNKLLPNKAMGASLQLNSCTKPNQLLEKLTSSPKSPVRTELVLGRPKVTETNIENNVTENVAGNDRVKDLLGCISIEKFAKALDTDWYKKLLKGLTEKVWWQTEAASKVASMVTKCREGNGKQRGTLSKGDTWLLFTGPDRVGKKKMACVISEQVSGSNPVMICLGRRRSDEEIAMNFRGKTVLDRIVEAVRRNPFSVIMLEDIDEADMLIRVNLKRAMERGRLADSYGREISLGNIIFILTSDWLPDNFKKLSSDQLLNEHKLESVASGGWQLRLQVSEKRAKRRADWLHDGDRLNKPRRESGSGLSLDLNLMADFDDDRTDGSLYSSELTDEDQIRRFPITSVPIELANFIDDAVVFKPVETLALKSEIRKKLSEKFSCITDDVSLEIEEEALEKILRGAWLGKTGLEEWLEKILLPSFHQLKSFLPSATSSDENFVVRLQVDNDSGVGNNGDMLPSSIRM